MKLILHHIVAPLLRRLLDATDRQVCWFANVTGDEE